MPPEIRKRLVPHSLADLRRDVATAYRIVANEGILDAFGHISVRHPGNPNRYFLSRSRAPSLVQPDDILEYDLDSNPIIPPKERPYSERVIHGEIFKARPDVNAVCHHHAPSIMPFAISGVPLVPVFHLGASMGASAPVWDSRDEFGDTNLLVVKPEEGASLRDAPSSGFTTSKLVSPNSSRLSQTGALAPIEAPRWNTGTSGTPEIANGMIDGAW